MSRSAGTFRIRLGGDQAMTRTFCWHCKNPSIGEATCSWCGVWIWELDPARVPACARPLLGAARRWGISDDGYRSSAVENASQDELRSLVHSIDDMSKADFDALNTWLVGPEAESVNPTDEYIAITCLTMATDEARSRIDD